MSAPARRASARRVALVAGALLLLAVFIALGSWQVQRRSWKLALMERVAQRVQAPVVAAPGPAQWAAVNTADDEYRHVSVTGRYLPLPATRVQAVTDLGGGFWLLSPLQQADGSIVLVNRGFVPATASPAPAAPPAGPVTVTGLLRISEPRGGFLRSNDAAAGRWYSRDVPAIASALGLASAAPYFIDADADAGPGAPPAEDIPNSVPNSAPNSAADSGPIAGLTVVRFQNNHLVYAITWYTLALMVAGAAVWLVRGERLRPGPPDRPPQRPAPAPGRVEPGDEGDAQD